MRTRAFSCALRGRRSPPATTRDSSPSASSRVVRLVALADVMADLTRFVIDSGATLHLAGASMKIRLLGDAVLRRRAWDLAEQLGWASTYNAEYVALTQLQADALVTLDAELARSVEGIVETASIDALL